ncbi:hypothetical protein CAEBREN_18345 [Caenorhabditis brenneri]|uniref:Uncharacterized protein n=1 Tax=Caenorhabditis brenneri TaxID=135651 RepID=G0MXD0_CAEBE|nr:hypothetical protein CAEBREN_18345 [Caenorhabditis brenneri]
MDQLIQYDCQGKNLCPELIIRANETETMRYQMVRRQIYIINELLRVGRQPYSPHSLLRLLEMGFFHGELYAIGNR